MCAEDDAVVIEVEDNGVGMDEATRQRLFDLFSRQKMPTTAFLPSGDDNGDIICAVMHKTLKMYKSIICLYSECVTLLFANPVLFFQNLKQSMRIIGGNKNDYE